MLDLLKYINFKLLIIFYCKSLYTVIFVTSMQDQP